MNPLRIIKNGIIDENPTFVQIIGMCPVLAVTTSVNNAVGMGIATTAVLVCSNIIISALRKIIPDSVRIPAYVVVISSFVTITEFIIKGFLPELNASLGIFIPLIVVNCIILARAECYANKKPVIDSAFDGLGMGLGFTAALIVIGSAREIIGAGSFYGLAVLPENFPLTVVMILPPGAFFTLGLAIALFNYLRGRGAK